ncbi:hypothetical protein J6590_004792 [Homalodisca vitripennis]|nr:hypothetical protein J6590_004792 [Homalodisca vitripennis]
MTKPRTRRVQIASPRTRYNYTNSRTYCTSTPERVRHHVEVARLELDQDSLIIYADLVPGRYDDDQSKNTGKGHGRHAQAQIGASIPSTIEKTICREICPGARLRPRTGAQIHRFRHSRGESGAEPRRNVALVMTGIVEVSDGTLGVSDTCPTKCVRVSVADSDCTSGSGRASLDLNRKNVF